MTKSLLSLKENLPKMSIRLSKLTIMYVQKSIQKGYKHSMFSKIKIINFILLFFLFFQSPVFSEIIKQIEIRGNDRIMIK